MKVIKLDRRYNGFGTWTHRTDFGMPYGAEARSRARLNFYEQRCFLTTQFGPGCFVWEAGTLKAHGRTVPIWGFDGDGNIFLSEEALTTFLLTEGRWL
jgi:hypothetical protein